VYLYSALFVVPHTQGAQAWITQCYLQLLLIYLPRKDERLSRPGWLTYSGRFTHISGHPSAAGRAYRTGKVRLSKTDILPTVPRNQLYASFHSLCYLMCRKVKSFKQVVFLSEQCAVSKLTTTVRSAVFWSWHRPTIVLLLVYDSRPVSRFITCCNAATARCYQHGAAGPWKVGDMRRSSLMAGNDKKT